MTTTLGTNENNDIYLGLDGNIVVLSGLQAVLGACATAAKSILGEQVLSINAGLPDFQTIWVGVPNTAIFKSYLRRALTNIPGVDEVGEISVTVQNNVLSYTATIQTEFGQGTING